MGGSIDKLKRFYDDARSNLESIVAVSTSRAQKARELVKEIEKLQRGDFDVEAEGGTTVTRQKPSRAGNRGAQNDEKRISIVKRVLQNADKALTASEVFEACKPEMDEGMAVKAFLNWLGRHGRDGRYFTRALVNGSRTYEYSLLSEAEEEK